MHGVRLDPFSSRLLAIRLKHGTRAAPEPRPEPAGALLDDDAHSLAPEQTDAAFALDDEAEEDEPYMPSRSAPDARAPTGSLVGGVTGSLLPDVLSHGVEPTDCDTCGGHEDAWDVRELTSEVRYLRKRVESLESAARHFGVSAADAAVDQGTVPASLS
jgi:hypothetical protein